MSNLPKGREIASDMALNPRIKCVVRAHCPPISLFTTPATWISALHRLKDSCSLLVLKYAGLYVGIFSASGRPFHSLSTASESLFLNLKFLDRNTVLSPAVSLQAMDGM